MVMNNTAFFTEYRRLLRIHAPSLCWPCDYLDQVADSIAGKPPHLEMQGSKIAQAAWQAVGGQGDVTTEKLRSLG